MGKAWDGVRYENGENTKSDICTFMRAFIVKLPVLIFANVFVYFMIFFTFLIVPIHYLGYTGWFTIILIISAIIGVGFGAYFAEKKFSCYLNARPLKPVRKEPTFWSLIKTGVKARHDKICVLMTFEDSNVGHGEEPSTEKPGAE